MIYELKSKKYCLAIITTRLIILCSDFYLIMSPIFLVIASILHVKKAIQNMHVGAIGIKKNLGFYWKSFK